MEEIILEHEASLYASFLNASLTAWQGSSGGWRCNLVHDIEPLEPHKSYPAKAIELAKRLLQKPDYKDADHRLIFLFGQEGVVVPNPMISEVLSSDERFQYWINGAWNELRYNLDPFVIGHYAPVASTAWRHAHIDTQFVPQDDRASEKAALVASVRRWGYMLLHLGVGIAAPSLPTIMLTGGTEEWVEHDVFGLMPGGTHYLDLRSWDGNDKEFTARDLVPTGGNILPGLQRK
jgi:hypothetical protein